MIKYPFLLVTEEQCGNVLSLSIQQNRFMLLPLENDNSLWTIPLNSVGFDSLSFLKEKSMTIQIPKSSFFMLNKEVHGFYRVCYESERMTLFGMCIKKENMEKTLNRQLTVADRIGLLSDALAMAACAHEATLTTVDYLDFISYFQEEENILFLFD